ncbi:NAD-dependent epimerase/dehydratase family protein [Rhodopseudomonas sp. RCAM05734]|uniref:NAD-dependent epimerase/dehydratase family protein n=1 Tax=Rhodopseudomonas sp. RCAM05734 TaxID=3457549 RepID=UPI00404503C1
MTEIADYVRALRGPIVVLGAGGFVGANLLRMLLKYRTDVFGVVRKLPAWRLDAIDRRHILEIDINDLAATRNMISSIRPSTVFDCVAYGAYSFETDYALIYRTNFSSLVQLVELLAETEFTALVHAGSSSEYGLNSAGPKEEEALQPNSHYSVSKVAASDYLSFAGKVRRLPVINLRLYSVYGPFEDTSRLIPNLVAKGMNREYPPFVNPDISRDFVYVDDVCEAFIFAAAKITPDLYGESFNIGTGQRTTIRELADVSAKVFDIPTQPNFGNMAGRAWDMSNWYAAPAKAAHELGWKARVGLEEGIKLTSEWYRTIGNTEFPARTKLGVGTPRRSISAIIACYMDEQAIPIMHQRLTAVFQKLDVDYEIIFVNDGSPDDCAGRIQELSVSDPHVLGIVHSRNFGSQMAFRSGMEMSVMQSCVLLDGDLQDPPELIEQFYEKWVEGADVIYGRRIKRDMPFIWGLLYKAFYRIFSKLSYVTIPHDAGDFSLIDRRVVGWLLHCPERDLFLRGLRAYVGFRQTGVDYIRPKRMFGESTNNLIKNLEWAKRGIFSFSNAPLKLLSAGGVILLGVSIFASIIVVAMRLLFPESAPRGVTSLLLVALFFGALNLFSVGLVGEYIAKILEEVKGRPRLIRSGIIRNGERSQLLPDGSVTP